MFYTFSKYLLILVTVAIFCLVGTFFYQGGGHLLKQNLYVLGHSGGIRALSDVSLNDDLVAGGYRFCWETGGNGRDGEPWCVRQSVGIYRQWSYSEAYISDALGVLGVFEDGCADPDALNVQAVRKDPDLNVLMGMWCAKHGSETKAEAEASALKTLRALTSTF